MIYKINKIDQLYKKLTFFICDMLILSLAVPIAQSMKSMHVLTT